MQREDGWCKSSGAFWNQSWSLGPEITVGADGFSRYREYECRVILNSGGNTDFVRPELILADPLGAFSFLMKIAESEFKER